MGQKRLTVSGVPTSQGLEGRYFEIIQGAGAFHVRFELADGKIEESDGLKQGLGMVFPDAPYSRFWITSETEQVVTVWAGWSQMVDNRSETSLSGAVALTNQATTLTALETKKVANARLGRRSVLIQTDSEIYIGGVGVTKDTGIRVNEDIEIECQSEIYAYSEYGANVRAMSEVN